MVQRFNDISLKVNICSICYRTCKLAFREEIEQNIIVNLKPHREYLDNSVTMEVQYSSATEIKRSKKRRNQQDKLNNNNRNEVAKLETQNVEHLQKINKIVANFENSLSFYHEKYEDMKNTIEEKLECITKLEKQNSCLQHGFNQLSARLECAENSLIHAKVELSYIRLDQQRDVDFSRPRRLYKTDCQVRDHKMSGGVWLYNNRDSNSNVDSGLAASTEYFSTESPGKSTTLTGFQMAPGGERRKSTTDPAPNDSVDDLQRRLDKLKGFN